MAPVRTRTRERRRRIRLSTQIEGAGNQSHHAGQGVSHHEPLPILAVLPVVSCQDTLNAQPASDLALELVLNEITLQARLTTNATGAVLALARSGELTCRATTGATAPDVAVCLRAKPGIAATCYETGEPRRVDDLGPDENTDAVAYRRSGVRSILVVPVQGEKGPILGILEIFSPRANAFCDRDVLTLQALARRIAANIELVLQSNVQQGTLQPNAWPPSHGPRNGVHGGMLAGALVRGGSAKQSHHDLQHKTQRKTARVQTPKFVLGIVEQRFKLKSVDWISVLAKSAIGLVLISGTMLAHSCWERSGNPKFVELIQQPMSQPIVTPQRSSERMISNRTPAPKMLLTVDPSTWPVRASAPPKIESSITILRQPVHRSNSTVVEAGPSASATENLATTSHTAKEPKSASKDPAASILPDKPTDGNDGVQVLATQAAMARLVQRIEPEYPNAARQQHIQGTVLLDVMVDETGAVSAISQVSGESQLMAAAEIAVKQWHFEPLMKNGKAKQFESRIPIDFKLVFEGSANH